MKRLFLLILGISISTSLFADTVQFDGSSLTQQSFNTLQNSAGANGTIELTNNITVNGTIRVTQEGLTIIGRRANGVRSRVTYNHRDVSVSPPSNGRDPNPVDPSILQSGDALRAIFIVDADGVQFRNLVIRGQHTPLVSRNVSFEEGARVSVGVESGILTARRGIRDLRVVGCAFRNVNVGIEYARGGLPNGMVVRNVRFFTGRGGINCGEGRGGPNALANSLALTSRMVLDNADVLRTNVPSKNFYSARGLTFDFGNGDHGFAVNDVPAVTFRGTTVTRCELRGMAFLGIDFNRCRNLTIGNSDPTQRNVFRIGNFGGLNFGGIHFEAGSHDITCTENIIINDRVAGEIPFTSCSYFSSIGGESHEAPHDITFTRNWHRGTPNTVFRRTIGENWIFVNEQTRDLEVGTGLGLSDFPRGVATARFRGSDNAFERAPFDGVNSVRFLNRTIQDLLD